MCSLDYLLKLGCLSYKKMQINILYKKPNTEICTKILYVLYFFYFTEKLIYLVLLFMVFTYKTCVLIALRVIDQTT